MTRQEYLLVKAMEECNELAQRLSKALHFGMAEIQPDPQANPQGLTNRQRIYREYWDLRAAMGMAGLDAWENNTESKAHEAAKVVKVEHFMRYSETLGTVTIDRRPPRHGYGCPHDGDDLTEPRPFDCRCPKEA